MSFDDLLEFKLEKLREIGLKQAEAKRKLAIMEHGRKILLAKLMKEKQLNKTGKELPVNAQEREASSDERYQNHITTLGIAIEEEAKWAWEKKIVDINFESWKTKMINNTVEKKHYG